MFTLIISMGFNAKIRLSHTGKEIISVKAERD
jgi:hypothetical protein